MNKILNPLLLPWVRWLMNLASQNGDAAEVRRLLRIENYLWYRENR